MLGIKLVKFGDSEKVWRGCQLLLNVIKKGENILTLMK
jgi:hypothetical protein